MANLVLSQVALSNTFNEFRQSYNDVANVVNSIQSDQTTNLQANTISVARTATVGNLNSQGFATVTGNFSVNSDKLSVTAASGLVSIANDLNANNRIYLHSSNGSVTVSNTIFTTNTIARHIESLGTGESILAGTTWHNDRGEDPEQHLVIGIGDIDGSHDIAVVNRSTGANGYAEFIAFSATGNSEDGWISTGINSPTYSQGAYSITGPDDGYLLYEPKNGTSGNGNLIIATGSGGSRNQIILGAGGFNNPANNQQMVITPGQSVAITINTQSSNTTTGALTVNGGIGLRGNLNVGGNVAITGTITLGGGGNTVSTSSLSVDNPMVFLGSNNAADILDLGIIGEYLSSGRKYAGLVRDASDSGIFKLFANNSTRPNNTVDFADANNAYGTLLVGTLRANNNISSTSNTTGTLVVTGGVGISENLNVGANVTVTGLATFTGGIRAQEIQEDVVDTTQGSNVIGCDYSLGNIFYRTSTNFSANFTMNITNAPTTDGRVFSVTLFQTQGSTGYRPTTLNINGSGATIKWVGGSAPTPTSSSGAMDVFSFTIIRRGAAYEVLATSTLNFA